MTSKGLQRVSLTFSPKSLGKPLINFSFQNGELQLVVNPRCDVARFPYEVSHDHINQGIDSI